MIAEKVFRVVTQNPWTEEEIAVVAEHGDFADAYQDLLDELYEIERDGRLDEARIKLDGAWPIRMTTADVTDLVCSGCGTAENLTLVSNTEWDEWTGAPFALCVSCDVETTAQLQELFQDFGREVRELEG